MPSHDTHLPLVVQRWAVGIANSINPMYDFTKKYVAGKSPIIWEAWNIDKYSDDIDDHEWLRSCCTRIQSLPRRDLCVIYIYTTQLFSHVTNYLRATSQGLSYDAELEHDPDEDFWGGYQMFIGSVENGSYHKYLKSSYPKSVMTKLKKVLKMEHSQMKYTLMNELFKDITPYLNSKYHSISRDKQVEFGDGIVFYDQACRVLKLKSAQLALKHNDCSEGLMKQALNVTSLKTFKRIYPFMTNNIWLQVLHQFVLDLDEIFTKMPMTEIPIHLYRGISDPKVKNSQQSDPAFVSTSFNKSVVKDFVDRENQCCIMQYTIPKGSQVLPVMTLTRYEAEMEVLLPRFVDRKSYAISSSRLTPEPKAKKHRKPLNILSYKPETKNDGHI